MQCCLCLPLENFYPFGVNESDLTVSPTTGFASILLSEDFIFYNEVRRLLYVRTYVCLAIAIMNVLLAM